ncbi:MAG: family 10 glycosylhydrolase [Burkholderiales bacterium]|nr:family 10 glycosylhydrolase [Burkholderiales bacterium]
MGVSAAARAPSGADGGADYHCRHALCPPACRRHATRAAAAAVTRRRWLGAGAALLLAACSTPTPTPGPPPGPTPVPGAPELPPPRREFRAAWVATVANIDWPSRPGLAPAALRAEVVALLDRARATGLNAIVLQVRPAGDAIYPSALEPWSEYLTGTQGRAPEGGWDPLAYWIEQAHRRGIELHAWFNPYRARASSAKSPLAPPHLALRRPELARAYGDQLWFDPGEPEALAQTLAVVADVVQRYDVDGVQIDDYFYPYPVADGAGNDLPFPDDASYTRYLGGGGSLARDDWRRANVDALVRQLGAAVHRRKRWVRFGVSPFGIGRPELRPPAVVGFSQYDKLYADVEHWLAEGWVDYLAPQLYWPIASPGQPFAPLLDSWIAAARGRPIWPGLYASQVPRWPARELLDQIALLRTRAGADGQILFSMIALLQDRGGLATALEQGPYAEPALVPAMPWLAGTEPLPAPPTLRRQGAQMSIAGGPIAGGALAPAHWVVWRRRSGVWRSALLPALGAPTPAPFDVENADTVAVAAVDRYGRLGPPATLHLP